MRTAASIRGLTALFALCASVFASAQLQAWVGTVAGPTNTIDDPVDVALDANGFAAVVGNSGGDIMIAKVNTSGAVLWSKRYNGAGNGTDTASAVAVDSAGNVIVTGKVWVTATLAAFTTMKFSASNGTLLWISSDSSSAGEGKDVVVGASGAVTAVGQHLNNGVVEMVTIGYAPSNGAPIFTSAYNGLGQDCLPQAIATDSTGAIYSLGTLSIDPLGSDMLVAKYDAAGVQQWAPKLDGSGGLDAGRSLAVDPNGFLYVVGRTQFYELDDDFATFKLRQSDGGIEWEQYYDGFGVFSDEAQTVSVAADGSAYVAGWLDDGRFYHVGVVKYTPGGSIAYELERLATKDIIPTVRGALDSGGNYVVTTTATSGNTRADIYTFFVAPDGSVPWYRLWNDGFNGNDVGSGVAIDAAGNIVAVGSGWAPGFGDDFKIVRYQRVSLTASTASAVGGTTVTMTLALNSKPTFATAFSISDTSANASAPASVTVPTTATSVTFNLTTTPVAVGETVAISVKNGPAQTSRTVTLLPPAPSGLALSPSSVVGGASSTATVTLNGAAPAGGLQVALWDNNANVTTPGTLTVPAGATTGTASLQIGEIATGATATISASANGGTQTASLTLNPNGPSALSVSPSTVIGGSSSQGMVTLAGPAPNGGASVALSSNNAAVTVPATVSVPAGSTSASFGVTTTPVAANVAVTLTATRNAISKTASLTVQRATLLTVTLNPNSVTGGAASTGTATLSGPAPTGGAVVTLTSNSAPRATVPANVTVTDGTTTATFTVTTFAQTADGSATITGSLNGISRAATLSILKPFLVTMMVTPDSVVGGNSLAGLVFLSGSPKAGTTGIVVSLSSSDASAIVPLSVRVPAGATSAGFVIATLPVAVDKIVTLTGTAGTTRTATIVLTP